MSSSAIFVMVVAMLVLWGGLALAILNISLHKTQLEPPNYHRDL